MKSLYAACGLAIAVVAGSAGARPAAAASPLVVAAPAANEATDFSARRRHAHVRRAHRVTVYRHRFPHEVWRPHYHYVRYYHARPYYYWPHTPYPYDNLTPFFPYGLGYALEPSW